MGKGVTRVGLGAGVVTALMAGLLAAWRFEPDDRANVGDGVADAVPGPGGGADPSGASQREGSAPRDPAPAPGPADRDPGAGRPRAKRKLAPGDLAPPFAAETLDGRPLRLADYHGKVVLLDFWATWCRPCTADHTHLRAAHEEMGADGRLVIVGLSLDADRAAPQRYVARTRLGWVQGFLGDWAATSVPDAYGVEGLPALVLVGPDGTVLATGGRVEDVRRALEAALKQ